MTEPQGSKAAAAGRLYVLDIGRGIIFTVNPDGSDRKDLVDKNTLLDRENMGEEHQPIKPTLQTGQTPFGEFTRLGSQIEMSKTPEYWADPIIVPKGSCKPEWLPR